MVSFTDESTPTRLLFVDDEKTVLQSLQEEFLEEEYDLQLALDTEEGIRILEEGEAEIVVCKPTLSRGDGAEFLRTVKKEYPYTHRLLFDDGREQEKVSRALTRGYATGSLQKPWKRKSLKREIDHILRIRSLLRRKKLLETISAVDRLPSLPSLYNEFLEAVFNDESAKKIASVIERDISLSARLLQIANSAFYGTARIASVQQALVRLGLDTVKDLVLAFSLVEEMDWTAEQYNRLRGLFTHSSLVNRHFGTVHKLKLGSPPPRKLASVGILHDIGSVIILQYFPERFDSTVANMEKHRGMTFHESELNLGYQWFMHEEIGAYFLNLWNLPDPLVEATLFHHAPDRVIGDLAESTGALWFADVLVSRCEVMPAADEDELLTGPETSYLDAAKTRLLIRQVREDLENPDLRLI